ncbi:phosphatase PAP2 family protein, partial [Neisseria dentiae]
AAAVTFALLMGLSRMVLGVHYPTDVLVGWITGTSTVIGLYLVLFRKLPGKPS